MNLQKSVCLDGWPLSIYGKVVLNLGTLNESILSASDIYLCIKPEANLSENCYVNLCAVWLSQQTNKISYHILNPDIDSLTSISLEMLTEELPQLLQSLLVSVEETINRVPIDELIFPKYIDIEDEFDSQPITNDTNSNSKTENRLKIGTNGSPKCGLKRREIITKNKPLQNRYTLRRMSNKIDLDNRGKTNVSYLRSVTASSTTTSFADVTKATATNTDNSIMPLFCLGGSFPHIDSDEDSGDDGIKSTTERKSIRFLFKIFYHLFMYRFIVHILFKQCQFFCMAWKTKLSNNQFINRDILFLIRIVQYTLQHPLKI